MHTSLKFAARMLLPVSLGLVALCAHADPKADIQAAMQQQRWADADALLTKTLDAHPNNALALFWHAQVLAKEGNDAEARSELEKAEEKDPGEHFSSNAKSLAAFKRHLEAKPARSAAPAASDSDAEAQALLERAAAVNDSKLRSAELQRAAAASPAEADASQAAAASAAQVSTELLDKVAAPSVTTFFEGGSSIWNVLSWMVGVGGVIFVILFVRGMGSEKRQESENLQKERDYWAGMLSDDKAALNDAVKASDGNDKLSQEAKLGNFDRARAAKSEIDASLNTKSTWSATSISVQKSLHKRTLDIVADIQGRVRPSEQAELNSTLSRAYGADSAMYRDAQVRMMAQAEANAQQRYYAGPTVVVQDSGPSFMTQMLMMEGISELAESRARTESLERQVHESRDDRTQSNVSSDNSWGGGNASNYVADDSNKRGAEVDTGGTSWGGGGNTDWGSTPDTSTTVDTSGSSSGGGGDGGW